MLGKAYGVVLEDNPVFQFSKGEVNLSEDAHVLPHLLKGG
jgi:hypothetical protein